MQMDNASTQTKIGQLLQATYCDTDAERVATHAKHVMELAHDIVNIMNNHPPEGVHEHGTETAGENTGTHDVLPHDIDNVDDV